MIDKIPKKWYIAVTNENKEVLSNWRTAGGDVNNGYLINSKDNKGLWYKIIPFGYEEITFEQFKIHILNEQPIKIKQENLSYLIDFLKQQQIN